MTRFTPCGLCGKDDTISCGIFKRGYGTGQLCERCLEAAAHVCLSTPKDWGETERIVREAREDWERSAAARNIPFESWFK